MGLFTHGVPRPVKPDQAIADFKDGVLTITLPKADDARPRTINIATSRVAATGADAILSDHLLESCVTRCVMVTDHLAPAANCNGHHCRKTVR